MPSDPRPPLLPPTRDPVWGPPLGGSLVADPPPVTTDVVIVGAGAVGLLTALQLARSGVPCAVLDADHPVAGTTGRSTAKASLLQGTRGSALLARHGMDTLAGYVTANRAGQELLASVAHDATAVATVRDAWTYATDDAGAASVWDEAAALRAVGLPAQVDAADELPFPTTASVRLPDQLQLDPRALVAHLVSRIRSLGVPVAWPLRAVGLESVEGGLEVRTVPGPGAQPAAPIRARWVVLATLLPFPLRTTAFAATTPGMSYAVVGEPTTAPAPRGMYLSTGSPTRSLRTCVTPDGRELLLVGGEGHPTGRGPDASTHVRALADWAREAFGVVHVERAWTAQDYSSADLLPHVGASPFGPEGLLLATGFGRWGMTNGAAAALVLAGLVQAAPPEWAGLFATRIATGTTGWRDAVAANLHVGAELARGWVGDPVGGAEPDEGQGVVRRALPRPTAVSLVAGVRRECSAVCTHLGGILRWNDLDRTWDCPLHGSRFGPDGGVVAGPATTPLSPG